MSEPRDDIRGVILLNLGGPDSLQAVRPFLYNLFSDRDIITLGPPFLQKPIAWFISRRRSGKTTDMYRRIGGKSPILDITSNQAEALEKALNEWAKESPDGSRGPRKYQVFVGMRYWKPFIDEAVKRLGSENIRDVVVLSLYPHFSKATTGSAVMEFQKHITGSGIRVSYINEWYDFPAYIDALASLITEGIAEFGQADFELVYSAHNLPLSLIEAGDPYLDHIKATVTKVNERLAASPYNLKSLKSTLAFQSKTGPVTWLEPSTEETLVRLAREGCKNLYMVPISFVSDHIETLYEIDIQYSELAKEHGINLKRCPALNTSPAFISAMRDLILSAPEGSPS